MQLAVLRLPSELRRAASLALDRAVEHAVAVGHLAGLAIAGRNLVSRGIAGKGHLATEADGLGGQFVLAVDAGRHPRLLGARGRRVAHERGADGRAVQAPDDPPARDAGVEPCLMPVHAGDVSGQPTVLEAQRPSQIAVGTVERTN